MFPMGSNSNLNRGQFSGSFGATNMPNTKPNTGSLGSGFTNMPKTPGPTGQISGLKGKPSPMRGTIRSAFGRM